MAPTCSCTCRGLFAVEALAGTEVRGELPLSSPIYELDGTSAGSRDPATRPDQNSMLAPMAGAAFVVGPPSGAATARLAFREVWSATADRQPGEPASGVNFEALSLTAAAHWRDRITISGGIRYNILFDELDDEQLALRVKLTPRQWVTFEHDFLAPTFDGDSIWNVFATGAYRDLRASYEVALPRGVKAYARGFVRYFAATADEVATVGPYAGQDVGAAAPGGRRAQGASVGAAWRSARGMARADGYWDDGYGGRKLGGDATARFKVRRPLELEARATGYTWRSDLETTGRPARASSSACRAAGVSSWARAFACTCCWRTMSGPSTAASSAAWRWSNWTPAYEALGSVAVAATIAFAAAAGVAAGLASASPATTEAAPVAPVGHAPAVAAHLPGRVAADPVRPRAPRAARGDVRGVPHRGRGFDRRGRQLDSRRGRVPRLPRDRSRESDEGGRCRAGGGALRCLPRRPRRPRLDAGRRR